MLGTGSQNCTCSCKENLTKILYSDVTPTLPRASLTEAPLWDHFKAEVPSSHLHHVIIPNCPFLRGKSSVAAGWWIPCLERKKSEKKIIPKGMTLFYWISSLFCCFGSSGLTVTGSNILNWSCFPVLWHQQISLAHADVLSRGWEENYWVRSALEAVLGKESAADSSPHCLRPHPFSFAHLSLLLLQGKPYLALQHFWNWERKSLSQIWSLENQIPALTRRILPSGEPILHLATSTSVPSAAGFISSFKIRACKEVSPAGSELEMCIFIWGDPTFSFTDCFFPVLQRGLQLFNYPSPSLDGCAQNCCGNRATV